MTKRVSVLGASHGGQALAAYLASMGCEVRLFDHPDFKANIDGINHKGGRIELVGAVRVVGKLSLASTDIREVVQGAEVVMVVVPAFAQEAMIRLAAPHLTGDQTVVLLPGNFGSFEARRLLRGVGGGRPIAIAEANSIPFACRQVEPGRVDVFGVKTHLDIAALPAADTPRVLRRLEGCFPIELVAGQNVLEIAFSNFNMLVHCPTAVLNAGWIENANGNFDFYGEGITESVCRVIERMDGERMAIGRRLRLDLVPFVRWWKETYRIDIASERLRDVILASKVHSGKPSTAPTSLRQRYITEDVPYLLVPVAGLGGLTGIPVPVTSSVITLASALTGTDFEREGRCLERLGLSGLSVEQIVRCL